jgi:Gas vesicle synthesis protein GvpL/GvpF
MSAPEPRIYVYGIVRLHDGDDLAAHVPVHGLHGGAVRALACGRLAALVSDLPPQASVPLDHVWRDPDRIKSLVLEHHRSRRRPGAHSAAVAFRSGVF